MDNPTPGISTNNCRPATERIRALLVLLGVALVGLLVLHILGIPLSEVKSLAMEFIEALADRPVLLYVALILVAGLPIPMSPVIILAAIVFTERFGLPLAVLICYSAIALGMIWTYFLSAYPLHRLFVGLVRHFSNKIPEVADHHKLRLTFIIRITPGIPFFIQNYTLGIARVPFAQYLWVSMLIQAFYTVGFVVSGGAIFKGKAGIAILGVSILLVTGLVINALRKRQGKPAPASPIPPNSST